MELEYLSASRIKTLSDCKKLFYHQYILQAFEDEPDSPFAQLGSALHEVLEEWRPEPSKFTRKDLVDMFADRFPPGPKHFLFKEGRRILWQLHLKRLMPGELLEVEQEFEMEAHGHKLKGVIDKVEKLPDGSLLITDYKSNKDVLPKQYLMQVSIYDLALEELYPGSDRQFELYYLRHNKSVPFKFDSTSRDKTVTILESVENIVAKNYDNKSAWPKLNKQDKVCTFCPLKKECW